MRKKTTYWLAFACLFMLCIFLCQCKKSALPGKTNETSSQNTQPRAVTTFVHPGVLRR
jgi:hypothetical protein